VTKTKYVRNRTFKYISLKFSKSIQHIYTKIKNNTVKHFNNKSAFQMGIQSASPIPKLHFCYNCIITTVATTQYPLLSHTHAPLYWRHTAHCPNTPQCALHENGFSQDARFFVHCARLCSETILHHKNQLSNI